MGNLTEVLDKNFAPLGTNFIDVETSSNSNNSYLLEAHRDDEFNDFRKPLKSIFETLNNGIYEHKKINCYILEQKHILITQPSKGIEYLLTPYSDYNDVLDNFTSDLIMDFGTIPIIIKSLNKHDKGEHVLINIEYTHVNYNEFEFIINKNDTLLKKSFVKKFKFELNNKYDLFKLILIIKELL